MTFLNPSFLYGLGAALLPVLIHLLNRRRATPVEFSNLALLRQLQQDRMRRVRVRQIILLVIRTLVILLAALAFARPALTGRVGAPGGAHVKTAAVLLLDQSIGMEYHTPTGRLFDRARARAGDALRLFEDRDRVYLVPFSDHPLTPTGDPVPSLLRERLAGVTVTRRIPDLAGALAASGGLLSGSGEIHRELYLFTNLARPGWRGVKDSLATFEGASVFISAERPSRLDNLAVTRFSVSNQVLTQGTPIGFDVEVWNAGEAAQNEVPIRFMFGGRRVEQTVIGLGPGESRRLRLHATPEVAGWVDGLVEAGDDPLPWDNARHVVVSVPGRISAVLVGETPQDTYYVERAFAASDRSRLVTARAIPRERLGDSDLTAADLVVLCGVSRLTPGQMAAIRNRVTLGGGVLIFPGERTDVAFYNERLLPTLIPMRLGALRGVPGKTDSYRSLGTIDRDHPLFRDLLPDKFEPPRFFASYDLERPDVAGEPDTVHPLARFGDGGLALCEARLGRGRVILLAGTPDLRWSDLPLRGVFVPLLHRMAQYAVDQAPEFDACLVGRTVDRPASGEGETAEVLSPDGESTMARPVAAGGETVYRIGPIETAGIWRVRSGGRETDRFASAVDARIGADLAPVSEDRVRRTFGRARLLRTVEAGESLAEVVTRARYGRELWTPLLILALALMAVEMILGRSSASRKEAET